MQKIAIISDDFPPYVRGGAGIVAGNEAHELVRQGYDLTVVTTVQDRSRAGDFHENGMRILRLYSEYHPRWRAYISLYNPQTIRGIQKLFKEEKFDLVHAHNVHEHISYHALKIAAQSGGQVVLTAHDAMMLAYGKVYPVEQALSRNTRYDIGFLTSTRYARLRFNPARNLIIRYYLRYCSDIFVVSEALAEVLEQGGIPRVQVLHNGIEVDAWRGEPSKIKSFQEEHGLRGKKVIFFGGRLTVAKGGLLILDYLADIKKTIPDVVLLIAGRIDSFAEHIQQKSKEVGLSDSIRWLGWISGSELIAAYCASDIVIVPSIYLDPFPTVNLEAGACGKPVVATSFGGSREAIVDGKTGYIWDPRDVQGFSSRMQELLLNENRSSEMGRRAYERMQTEFSLPLHIKQLLHLSAERT